MDKAAKKKLRKKVTLIKAERKAYATSLKVADKMLAEVYKKLKRKMRPGGGRSKGNGFENAIAKMVVAAFAERGIRRKDCYRTPLSGGHKYAKHEDPGDLVLSKRLREIFPFHVECKAYKEVDLNPFWLPEKKWKKSWKVKAWLEQVTSACRRKDLNPLLVFKANNQEELAAVPQLMPIIVKIMPRHKFRYKDEDWYLVRFKSLLRVMVKHLNGKE